MVFKAAAVRSRSWPPPSAGGAAPAESAFPGGNGRIVFQRGAPYDGGRRASI